MAKTTKTAPRAKAEARPTEAATKSLETGMETMTDMASKFSGYTEDGVKALKDSAALSTETIREIGTRNMSFMTQAMEQGVEMTQALASARDPREIMQIQSGYAKSMFSAYTAEMTAQAELCMGAWREAAKPFMMRLAK
ncbi:MAG: phasin [Hyphomonas sp.]